MNQPIFAIQARYMGTYIPGVTMTNWQYTLVPIFPGGTAGTPVSNSTGPIANAGLNGVDVVHVKWQPQVGAIAYNLFRATGNSPAPTTGDPWASFTSELGVKDIGFPATTRS
jgi:hypothetical protein